MSDPIFETETVPKGKKPITEERREQLRETLKKARTIGKQKREAKKKAEIIDEVKNDEALEIIEPPPPKPKKKKMKTIEVEDETEAEMEARIEKKIIDRIHKEVEERRRVKELQDLKNEIAELKSQAQIKKENALEKKEEKQFIKERTQELKEEVKNEVKKPIPTHSSFSVTRGSRLRRFY